MSTDRRTGRAGNVGRAITLVAPVDELSMRAIERLTGQPVNVSASGVWRNKIDGEASGKNAFLPASRSAAQWYRSFRPRRAR